MSVLGKNILFEHDEDLLRSKFTQSTWTDEFYGKEKTMFILFNLK